MTCILGIFFPPQWLRLKDQIGNPSGVLKRGLQVCRGEMDPTALQQLAPGDGLQPSTIGSSSVSHEYDGSP